MRKVLGIFLILILLGIQSSHAQSMTVNELMDKMSQLFKMECDTTDGEKYVYERTVKLPKTDLFFNLLNEDELYFSYIKNNYSTVDYRTARSYYPDLEQATKVLTKSLRQDSVYETCAIEMAYYYLVDKGVKVTGYRPPAKRVVSKNELMTIASRFFYAHSVAGAVDSIGFHVCVGINGYQNNKNLLTNPLVEAFCFSALMQNLNNPSYSYWSYCRQEVKRIRNKYRTMTGSEERIIMARNEMYMLMKENKELERVLITEYTRKKSILNFLLEE